MKKCITPRDFNRFMDDSPDPRFIARLEAHCRDCEKCARELESWTDLKEKLSSASRIAMPAGFKEKVMSRVVKEKILPAQPAAGTRQFLAAAIFFLAALYSIFRPLLRPLLLDMVSRSVKSISVLLYNFLSSMGIDPAVLIRFFGNILANLPNLVPFFMAGTAVMTVVFVLLILRGRTARQSG
ncbi:MAG: hypothetical protein GXX04_00680 [Clostridiaceae bacterium]|nr:hypothetical protein [Clostridiaceae bacterium]